MNKVLILLSVIFLNQALARDVGEGPDHHDSGSSTSRHISDHVTNTVRSNVFGGVGSEFQKNSLSSSSIESIEKEFAFNPSYKVLKSRGAFTTSFAIALPSNLLRVNSLDFTYSSQSFQRLGFGVGFMISIPSISHDMIAKKAYLVTGSNIEELIAINNAGVNLSARVRSLSGQTIKSHHRKRMENDFSHIVELNSSANDRYQWIIFSTDGKASIFDRLGRLVKIVDRRGNSLNYQWNECHVSEISTSDWRISFQYEQELGVSFRYGYECSNKKLTSIRLNHANNTKNYVFTYQDDHYLSDVRVEGANIPVFNATYDQTNIEETSYSSQRYEVDHVYLPWGEQIEKFPTKTGSGIHNFYIDVTGDGIADKVQYDISEISRILEQRPVSAPSSNAWRFSSSMTFSPGRVDNGRFYFDSNSQDTVVRDHEFYKMDMRVEPTAIKGSKRQAYFIDVNNDGLKEVILCTSRLQDRENREECNLVYTTVKDDQLYRNHYLANPQNYVNYISNSIRYKNVALAHSITGADCYKTSILDINLDSFPDFICRDNVIYFGSRTGFHKRVIPASEIASAYGHYYDIPENSSLLDLDGNFKYEVASHTQVLNNPVTGDFIKVTDSGSYIIQSDLGKKVITSLNSNWGGRHTIFYELQKGLTVVSSIEKVESDDNRLKQNYTYHGNTIDPVHFFRLGFTSVEVENEGKAQSIEGTKEKFEFIYDLDYNAIVLDSRPQLQPNLSRQIVYDGNNTEYVESIFERAYLEFENGRIYPYLQRKAEKKKAQDGYWLQPVSTIARYELFPWFGNSLLPRETWMLDADAQDLVAVFSHSQQGDIVKKHTSYTFDANNYVYSPTKHQVLDQDDVTLLAPINKSYNSYGELAEVSDGEVTYGFEYDAKGRLIRKASNQDEIETYGDYIGETAVARILSSNLSGEVHLENYDILSSKPLVVIDEFQNRYVFEYFPYGGVSRIERNGVVVKEREINFSRNKISDSVMGMTKHYQLDGLGHVTNYSVPYRRNRYEENFVKASDGRLLESTIGNYTQQLRYNHLGHVSRKNDSDGNSWEFIEAGDYKESKFNAMTLNLKRLNNKQEVVLHTSYLMGEYEYNRDKLGQLLDTRSSDTRMSNYWHRDNQGRINLFERFLRRDPLREYIKIQKSYSNHGLTVSTNSNEVKNLRADGKILIYRNADTTIQNSWNIFGPVEKQITSGQNILSFATDYSEHGLLTQVKLTSNREEITKLGYEHDQFDRIVKRFFGNFELRFSYDQDRIINIQPYISGFRYDDQGRLTQIDYGRGVRQQIEYSALGQVVSKSLCLRNRCESYAVNYENKHFISREQLSGQVTFNKEYSYAQQRDGVRISLAGARRILHTEQGNVSEVSGDSLTWAATNLVKIGDDHEVIYNDEGSGIKFSSPNEIIYRLSDDYLVVNGQHIVKVQVKGLLIGIMVDSDFYPVLSDVRNSPLSFFSDRGELLFTRKYEIWGDYQLDCKNRCEIDSVIKFGHAGLIKSFATKNLLWSKSRVYSPEIKQWLSLDPVLYNRPESFTEASENWNGFVYCGNDPVNFVDPSGYSATLIADMVIEYGTSYSETEIIGSVIGSSIGTAIGNVPGGLIGGVIGGAIGDSLSPTKGIDPSEDERMIRAREEHLFRESLKKQGVDLQEIDKLRDSVDYDSISIRNDSNLRESADNYERPENKCEVPR